MAGYTVGNLIRKNRLSRGSADADAVVFEGQRRTYGELDANTNKLASGLIARGLAPGDRVAVLSKNRIEWVEIFFAVAKAGAVVVPINYLVTASELSYMMEDSGSTWLFAENAFTSVVEPQIARPDMNVVMIDEPVAGAVDFEEIVSAGSVDEVDLIVDVNDLFLLQYTSGTTGRPKAAMHTHSTVLFNAIIQPYELELSQRDVYLCVPALCWAAGFHDFCLVLWLMGGTVVLNPSRALDADQLCATIAAEKVSVVVLVPSVLRIVLASGALAKHDLSSLRIALTGAEPVTPAMLDQLSESLPSCAPVQGYGMSEFPIFTAMLTADEARERVGSAGKSSALCELRVVDENGDDTPTGEEGEIISRAASTMSGYWNRAEATDESLRNGWFHTGDRGYVDEDGYLFIAGRAKDMIITGGLNVYPAEIERVLLEHSDVSEAAVIAGVDEGLGEVGQAIVVFRDGVEGDMDALEGHVRSELASFKVPRIWRARSEPLPRTASGKIQKYVLKEEYDR